MGSIKDRTELCLQRYQDIEKIIPENDGVSPDFELFHNEVIDEADDLRTIAKDIGALPDPKDGPLPPLEERLAEHKSLADELLDVLEEIHANLDWVYQICSGQEERIFDFVKAVEVLRERERNGNIEGEDLAEKMKTEGVGEALKLWETLDGNSDNMKPPPAYTISTPSLNPQSATSPFHITTTTSPTQPSSPKSHPQTSQAPQFHPHNPQKRPQPPQPPPSP
ncbi:hypothetical protein G7Y79_00050g086200 [Physcia stellaris]|nr:hypothetical protein G7Y79_00050g086200 [Physcia stellaris]